MKKNNLDEAQEQKMLKIEHNAYGIGYWGLLAAILLESALEPGNLKLLAGECLVFMTMCIYVIAACVKNGIWERRLKPTRKTNVIVSLIASGILGAFNFVVSYHNYHAVYGSLAGSAMVFIGSFALCYTALALVSKLYKRRVKKLEEEIEE